MPPAAYRRALRVQAAQKLLRRGEPARDVALACGFYDQAHLTRHFKAVTGVTPMRWRRLMTRIRLRWLALCHR
jgi:AraC-like DNA-binding protein